jgi:hypothetical protein
MLEKFSSNKMRAFDGAIKPEDLNRIFKFDYGQIAVFVLRFVVGYFTSSSKNCMHI